MKPWTRTLFIMSAFIIILALVLSASIDHRNNNSNKEQGKDKDKDNKNGNDEDHGANAEKITICHKTGSAKNPYVEITVANAAASHGHASHAGDIIPAPAGGCPTQ